MDKESIYQLQCLDCNCNDCMFMARDSFKRKESLELHKKWQLDYFNAIRNKLYEKAEKWKLKGFLDKWESVKDEADKMRFEFNPSDAALHYGNCEKFNKPMSFIPAICQMETQECFEHR